MTAGQDITISLSEWRACLAVTRRSPAHAPSSWTCWSVAVPAFPLLKHSYAYVPLLTIPYLCYPIGRGHLDPEWHASDQTLPWRLDSMVVVRSTLLHAHCGSLHHNLSAKRRDYTHLGQTHSAHHRAGSILEGLWWGFWSVICHTLCYQFCQFCTV